MDVVRLLMILQTFYLAFGLVWDFAVADKVGGYLVAIASSLQSRFISGPRSLDVTYRGIKHHLLL
jgi:hypothetical protein